jgi:hypothetical protein
VQGAGRFAYPGVMSFVFRVNAVLGQPTGTATTRNSAISLSVLATGAVLLVVVGGGAFAAQDK